MMDFCYQNTFKIARFGDCARDIQQMTGYRVIEASAVLFDVTVDELMSENRSRTLADARCIAMSVLRLSFKITLRQIGRMLLRDHSTVLYAISKYDDLYGRDKSFTQKADKLREMLND
jgi:chromosomal replication initiator protein